MACLTTNHHISSSSPPPHSYSKLTQPCGSLYPSFQVIRFSCQAAPILASLTYRKHAEHALLKVTHRSDNSAPPSNPLAPRQSITNSILLPPDKRQDPAAFSSVQPLAAQPWHHLFEQPMRHRHILCSLESHRQSHLALPHSSIVRFGVSAKQQKWTTALILIIRQFSDAQSAAPPPTMTVPVPPPPAYDLLPSTMMSSFHAMLLHPHRSK